MIASGDLLVCIPKSRGNDFLRRLSGIECSIGQEQEHFWVRFSSASARAAENVALASSLPGIRFFANADGKLTRLGQNLPSREIRDLDWMPIDQFVHWELPIAAMAPERQTSCRQALQLVRSSVANPAVAMIVELALLERWISTAAAIRFERLEFAICHGNDRQEAIVIGTPLPPLSGTQLWRYGDALLPVGYCCSPELPPDSLSQVFGLPSMHWLVWRSGDDWSTLPRATMRTMSRGSVRASRQYPADAIR